jgi:hypothetical protein
MAARGGTRDAFTAGTTPARRVTTIPTTSEAPTAPALSVRPPAGRPNPKAAKRPFRPRATTTPPNRPITEATAPITAASPTTEARTWRRLAPRARSRADSRVR